jgi:hypothetical protein
VRIECRRQSAGEVKKASKIIAAYNKGMLDAVF